MSTDLAWQPSLFDGGDGRVRVDAAFARLRRRDLADGAWVDVAPAWCEGADGLLARLPDGRWKAAAATLNLRERGIEALRDPKVQASLAEGLRRMAWRNELDAGQPGTGDAMLFRERAATAKTAYDVLGDPVLRRVLTTALGLPQAIVVQPVETQARALASRLDLGKLQNPREVAKLAERYVVAAAGSGGSAGAASPLLSLFPAGGLLA